MRHVIGMLLLAPHKPGVPVVYTVSGKGTQKNLMEAGGRQHLGRRLRVKENEVLSSCQKNITEMTKSYYENYHYLFGERDTYKTRPDRRNPTRIHWEGRKHGETD